MRLRRPRSLLHTARQSVAVLLLGAALLLALRPAPPGATAAAPVGDPVVVAARDLPPGATLTSGDLVVVRLPPAAVPDGSSAAPDALTGRVLAAGLRGGEPVTDVRLVGPGLTELLPDGRVAVPVRLADLEVASLARPGSRVDVLAARADADRAEVVARDALVLAVPGERPEPAVVDGGLLLLAVDDATAAVLAAAAASATLTVSLSAPG